MLSTTAAIGLTLVLPVPFLALGIKVLFVASLLRKKAQASKHWHQARAIIEQSSYDVSTTSIGSASEPAGEFRRMYVPKIKFSYEVDGRQFRSTDLAIFDLSCNREPVVRELMAPFKVGTICVAYYDPKKPDLAILLPGREADTWKGFLFGVMLIFFGLMGLGVVWLLSGGGTK